MKALLGVGFALGAWLVLRSKSNQKHERHLARDEVKRWEGEGGNVPEVVTPDPVTRSAAV